MIEYSSYPRYHRIHSLRRSINTSDTRNDSFVRSYDDNERTRSVDASSIMRVPSPVTCDVLTMFFGGALQDHDGW